MGDLANAILGARRVLNGARRADGSFPDKTDLGPSYTAFVLIALHYAEHDLPAEQTAKVVTWLRRQQRADGSYVGYPFATSGDLCATAAVWAALRVVGVAESDPAVTRAKVFVDAHGGLDEVARELYTKTNFAGLFVAMAGFIAPSKVPMAPPALLLNRPMEAFLRKRFDYLTLVVGLVCAGAIVDALRRAAGEASAAEAASHGFFGEIEATFRRAALAVGNKLESLDDAGALSFLGVYQNPNGSLDDTTLQTALLVAAYRALRLPRTDERVTRAAGWLHGMLIAGHDEAWFSAFTGDVWSTAIAARALLRSGTSASDPDLMKTVEWFLDHQLLDEKLILTTSKPHAPKVGGWAFEGSNVTMPDCDDTGLVLVTLGMTSESETGEPLQEPLGGRVLTAVARATAWLEGNQNPDGGWSAFDYWDGEKPKGPLYTEQIGILSGNWLHTIENILSPPPGLGSPAWEDVTGRVLFGLGYAGYTTSSPVVARAIGFLRNQQLDHGGWWGRWMVNYLPTTANILLGLSAVDLPTIDPMVQRGLDFLLAHQNPDGGWGESEATYPNPSLAGMGPSMPPLTGLVLSALIDCGRGNTAAVERGIQYLIDQQRPDGSWPNNNWLHAFFPPQSYYLYFLMPAIYPLEALGRYDELRRTGELDKDGTDAASRARAEQLGHKEPVPERPGGRTWPDSFLDQMRLQGDPLADELIKSIFTTHQVGEVNSILKTLLRSDDPVPSGLPPLARDYFESSAVLPSFTNPDALDLASRLFGRIGWSIAAGLFCASLPQTYCSAKGAKVLLYTGRLETDARQRILETAQMIFDVTDPGGLGPHGRGIRSSQKVRLMHGAIRHLTLQQARWNMADGLPINQEDLAATLMAFSTVILDALDRMKVSVTHDEREAWMHLWRVVGAVMGLDPQILPVDEADGAAMMEAYRRRQWQSSPQGSLLGAALVGCMEEYMLAPWLKQLPAMLVRHLAGDHCADVLGMPRSDWASLLVDGADDVLDFFDPAGFDRGIDALIERFNQGLMKALISVQRGGKDAPFRIPPSLRST